MQEQEIYVIPYNFSSGTVIAGETYRTRNLVEGIVLSVPVIILVFALGRSLTLAVRLSITLSTALPLLLLGIVGVGGNSLTGFLNIYFRYLNHRRKLLYNPRVKHESRPINLNQLHNQMALPRDKMLALIEQYRQKTSQGEGALESDILFFEEDIGILPTPDEYMTRRERRSLKKAQAAQKKIKDGDGHKNGKNQTGRLKSWKSASKGKQEKQSGPGKGPEVGKKGRIPKKEKPTRENGLKKERRRSSSPSRAPRNISRSGKSSTESS